ncbi:oligosaccharide flippase family protein [Candidatus Fermentibacteria bacterium]|nr:oligosaccharide flippase family protein [Candidatus Fermentibacteria bacterium]
MRTLIAVQGVLMARILGPQDLGRFAVLTSALTLSAIVAQLGIPSALSRYLPLCREPALQSRLRDMAAATGIVWSCVVGLILALPATGRLLSEEPWVRAWLVSGVVVLPLQTLIQASLSLLHGQSRFPRKAAVETSAAAITFMLIIAGTLTHGLSGAVWGKLAAALVVAAVVSAATGVRRPRRIGFPPGFWRFAVLSLASSSFSTMLHTADTLVLGALRIPAGDIGSYRLASLMYSFLSMVPAAAMHTLFPRLVQAYDKPEQLRAICLGSIRYLMVFGIAAAAIGIYGVPLVVAPLVGTEYSAGIPFVRALSLGLLFRPIVLWAGSVILAMGRPGLNLTLLMATGALNLALNIVLVSSHGPIGAAWATVASEATSALLGGGAVLWLLRDGRRG